MNPGITKTFLAGHDWPELVRDNHGQLSSLIEARLGYKSAASPLFSKADLDAHAPPKGYFMRHQIVMGDAEKYGFNINADAYPGDTLEKYHPTFVSNGHVFREHHNQDPKKAIGRIVAAKYGRQLGRVETLEHLEIKKAEAEYEAAKAGKPLLASQACRVPFDVCNVCGNRAKYASNYCDDMRYRPKQYIASKQKYAFVLNPVTKFFDSSVVANPAAREARHIAYRFNGDASGMQKAANEGAVLLGAERAAAENLVLSGGWDMPEAQEKILLKLAAVETGNCEPYLRKMASVSTLGAHSLTDADIKELSRLMPRTLWSKLASSGAFLPLDAFAAYITGESLQHVRGLPAYKQACACLPSIFSNLMSAVAGDTCALEPDDDSLFQAGDASVDAHDPANGDAVDKVLERVTDECSALEEPVRKRVLSITIKSSAVIVPAPRNNSLAELYACYKLAAATEMIARGHNPLLITTGALQNHAQL